MKTKFLLIFLLILSLSCEQNQTLEVKEISIIPEPNSLVLEDGFYSLSKNFTITTDVQSKEIAQLFAEMVEPILTFHPKVKIKSSTASRGLDIRLDESINEIGKEGYQLDISKKLIQIRANHPSGIFYGLQSLLQLFPPEGFSNSPQKEILIPCLSIKDSPEFSWRGLMVDCSRTFWSKQFIKRYIDLLSYYKLNILHLHLVDDQGWRLEIKKYPELTSKGASFPEGYNEPEERQGFYSQEDIKEIVAYASKRNVTIIPEIEMPGHVLSALSVFPHLSCEGGPFEIHPFFKGPGIHKDIYCAGEEEVFNFIENVLDEVIELFPAEYIHIGGDEAPKNRWQECPKCQKRIKEEGLKDELELQSWFIKRVEKYLNKKGKKLIGWDEILEGGLSKTASVMYWRGWMPEVPKEVVGHGNKLIMSPTSHCYFDYNYEAISTEKVYGFDPIPEELPDSLKHLIMGGQANFWSHIDRTEQDFDKQIFPRILSLSEVLWSKEEVRDWDKFEAKLSTHKIILTSLGVNFKEELTDKNITEK